MRNFWRRRAAVAGVIAIVFGLLLLRRSHGAGVDYIIDDGTSERAIGIDGGEDSLWFNTFPVQSGGEVIHSISALFGRAGITVSITNLPIKILLYEDADGGLPWNAVLKRSIDASTQSPNTLHVYDIPPTEIHGTLLAAVLYRNTTTVNKSISGFDMTAPTFSDRSYYGYAVGMNEADLSSIPAGQFGTIESLGQVGNWIVRANGDPIPETHSALAAGFIGGGILLMLRPILRPMLPRRYSPPSGGSGV